MTDQPPLDYVPLDYVPLDRINEPQPTEPTIFTPVGVRKGLIAAGVTAVLIGAFYVSPQACIAIAIMIACGTAGSRFASYLNKLDDAKAAADADA